MAFFEMSVYHLRNLPAKQQQEQGLYVLVMRRWPRGIPNTLIDVWLKDAGPLPETLAAFRGGHLSYDAFAQQYRREQQEQQSCSVVTKNQMRRAEAVYPCSSLEYLKLLEQEHGKLTLLCWESGIPCHRYELLQLLAARDDVGRY